MQAAGEAGPPALVEDRLVQVLDVPVGLRPAGADASRTELLNGREKLAAGEV
jgi:hypothetical protein